MMNSAHFRCLMRSAERHCACAYASPAVLNACDIQAMLNFLRVPHTQASARNVCLPRVRA